MIDAFSLGATLYVPATHPDLLDILNGERYPNLRSVVVCLEDAVKEVDVDRAFEHLLQVSAKMKCTPGLMRFIRPRDLSMVTGRMLDKSVLHNFTGLVLPKFKSADLLVWWQAVSAVSSWRVMPTLETEEVFSRSAMQFLADELDKLPEFKSRILALRIGGNDLMQLLGIRRDRVRTLYDGPLRNVISDLVTVFSPRGLNLTSPVCEIIDDPLLLSKESEMDVAYGLVGKTIIHPQQIDIVHQSWMVDEAELSEAGAILSPQAEAVFKSRGAMCEVATHWKWADRIKRRALHYGVRRAHN